MVSGNFAQDASGEPASTVECTYCSKENLLADAKCSRCGVSLPTLEMLISRSARFPVRPHSLLIEILRWAAVLPAAVAVYIAAQLFVILLSLFQADGIISGDSWSKLMSSAACPYFMVVLGARVAPRFHLITAISLTVLHGIAMGALLATAIIYGQQPTSGLWWLIAAGIIGVIASIVACVQIHKDEPIK